MGSSRLRQSETSVVEEDILATIATAHQVVSGISKRAGSGSLIPKFESQFTALPFRAFLLAAQLFHSLPRSAGVIVYTGQWQEARHVETG